jgi:hypothetical protein
MSGAAAPPAGISHVPAPWTTESECWLLTVFLGSKLPEGVYDPLEASSSAFANSKEAGKFEGGLGMIMIVRYKETPVGRSLSTLGFRGGRLPGLTVRGTFPLVF